MEIYDDDPSDELLSLERPEFLTISGDIQGSRDNSWNPREFLERIERLPGRSKVTGLCVNFHTHVEDCEFLNHFPNVEGLWVSGRRLRSLAGIGRLRQLWHVRVDTGKNNLMRLDALPDSSVTALTICKPRTADIEVINACPRLTKLDLYGGDPTPFVRLESTRLQSLKLIRNSMAEIADLGLLGTVTELHIGHSRTLRGVSCLLPNVRKLTLESCGKFDVATLANLPNLRYLRIAGATLPFNLGDLAQFAHLADLTIACAKLSTEPETLSGFPMLNRLWMNPVRDDFTARIGAQLPQARVCNGDILTIGGIPQTDIRPYYEQPTNN